MDEETLETIHRLEGRIEGLHQALFAIMSVLTWRDRTLAEELGTGLFGTFIDASDKNPHTAAQEELRSLGNKLTDLEEARAESEKPADGQG